MRVLAAVPLLMAVLTWAPAAAQAAPCTPPVVSAVACENTQPGAAPSTWQIDGAGDPTIQGYATQMSVNKGQTIDFKIKSATSDYRIDILRLGYYGGDGARLMEGGLAPTGTSTQPPCDTDSSSGLVDCGNWAVSRSWAVPDTAVSGVYIAHLVRNDTGGESHIPFVVRDDARHADVVLQTSDTTWQAYNTYGGNSLYKCTVACPPGNPSTYKAAYKVSYNRPFNTEDDDSGRSALFTGPEDNLIRFVEANGYDVNYVSGVDVHRRGNLLLNHNVFISSGHDEYWSASQRESMEDARDAGVNLAFFTGNTGFWKTRWENSDRTLVSYKDTHFPAQEDPVEWTGTWRDPRFLTDADGVTPENALTGLSFLVTAGTSRITVPHAFREMRLWRNTAVEALDPGQSLQLAPDTLGYEWDVDADNGFRPAGQFQLSSTTVSGLEVFTDYGSQVTRGATATHNMTMYRAPSGARVFNSGTVQWSWGLDDWNPGGNPVDRTMQQATVNLFADLGAQPATRLSTLVAASASPDTTAPVATLTAPPSTVADGARITLSGTATDGGGGAVAGVEVSTDGGATWKPASGTTAWTYSWVAHGSPTSNVRVRAVDDSGNLGTATPGVTVNVTCPCSLWGPEIIPSTPDAGDPTPVELGVKFRADVFGTVTGVRFYKSAQNTGTHVGSLWTAGGTRLAQATFIGESGSGWQSVTFDAPVEIHPNTTYIASYHAPDGHYAATPAYFYRSPAPGPNGGAEPDARPLHAVRTTGGEVNGVFGYSATSTFPTGTSDATNYWVDVAFRPEPAPGAVTGVTAAEGGRTSANVSWNAPASGGRVTSYVVTPYVGSTAQTPRTVSGTSTTVTGLTTGTTYTFRVRATNPNGSGTESPASNAVTPSGPAAPAAPTGVAADAADNTARVTWSVPAADGDSPITGYTVTPFVEGAPQAPVQAGASATSATVPDLTNGTAYRFRVTARNAVGVGAASADSNAVTPQATLLGLQTPANPDAQDGRAVELGVRFRADHDGSVTGVRFYKSAANTGVHTGSLWTANGTRLAQATFTDETASGWQTVTFGSPVPVTAGTTYVASYFAPLGHYAATPQGLLGGIDAPPLHALPGASGANGVYAYGASSTFPGVAYNSANYWVDAMYAVPKPGQVTGVSATGDRAAANVSWTAPSSGGPVTSYRVTPYVGSSPQTPKTVAATATSTAVTGLSTGTTYTFRVRALNASGAGPDSAPSGPVTPAAAVRPAAPTDVHARPATSSARVIWVPSASDGDSPITSQTVTPYAGSVAQAPVTVGATASSTTVTGLDDGTAYTFRVTAQNAVGSSPDSAASNAVTPRATIFDFATPATADAGDPNPVTVGVKFTSNHPGSITGIRFHKAAANTGTHVGALWSASGTRLAEVTFTGETNSGWQHALFDAPVPITPGTTYVASYHAPNGHYSVSPGALSSAVDRAPLQATGNATSPNGVFAYGPASSFPTGSYNAADYGVDVMFAGAPAPGAVGAVTAAAGQRSADVSWTAPTSGGPPTSYTVTPYIGSTAQTATTVTGTPPATTRTITGLTAGTTYTFRVRAGNPGGAGPESAASNAVTPAGAGPPGAPTGVGALADTGSAVVRWTAPASDGGGTITSYAITPRAGATALTPVVVGASETVARVTGLTNGTAYTFTVAAVNAAGTGAASSASAAVVPRTSLLGLAAPALADAGDGRAVSLGVKFTSDVDGTVTGLRFYKSAANTGTHVGTLWSATGTRLGEAAFTGGTASGWQTAALATPVAITADTTYVASYHAPNGHYAATGGLFGSGPLDVPPLHGVGNATSPNGVYAYGAAPTFPTSSWNATSYWVDVLFAPEAGS